MCPATLIAIKRSRCNKPPSGSKCQTCQKPKKCKNTSTSTHDDKQVERRTGRQLDCGHIFPFLSSPEGYLLIHPKMISYENENICMLTSNPCEMIVSHKERSDCDKVFLRMCQNTGQNQSCKCQLLNTKPKDINPFTKESRCAMHYNTKSSVPFKSTTERHESYQYYRPNERHSYSEDATRPLINSDNRNVISDDGQKLENDKAVRWKTNNSTMQMESRSAIYYNPESSVPFESTKQPQESYKLKEYQSQNRPNERHNYSKDATELLMNSDNRSVISDGGHQNDKIARRKAKNSTMESLSAKHNNPESIVPFESTKEPHESSKLKKHKSHSPPNKTHNYSEDINPFAKESRSAMHHNPESSVPFEATKEPHESSKLKEYQSQNAPNETHNHSEDATDDALMNSDNPNVISEDEKKLQYDKVAQRNTKSSMFSFVNEPASEKQPEPEISRESLDQYQSEDIAAAVTLQKHVRGFLARKDMQRKNEAATKIQRAFRDHKAKDGKNEEGDYSSSNRRNSVKRSHSSEDMEPVDEVPNLLKNLDTPKGALLLFGGVDPSLPCSRKNTGREVYMYMVDGNLWMQVGRIPEPRSHFGIARMNNDVYIVGGTDPRFTTSNDRNLVVQSVWNVSLRLGIWTTHPDLPMDLPSPRSHFGCVSKDGIMYVIGGNDVNFRATETCLKYDTLTNMWSTMAELDNPRVSMGIAVYQNRIWIAGGLSKNHDMPVYDSVLSYDVLTDNWLRMESLPLPRAFCSLVVSRDRFTRLYIVGGAGPRDKYDKKNKSIPDILAYDPNVHQWKEAGVLLNPRHGHTATAIDEKIVVLGGVISSKQAATKSLEIFNTSTSHSNGGRKIHQKLSGMGVVPLT